MGILAVLFASFVGWVYFSTLQPDRVQSALVTTQVDAPLISEEEEIKLLNWNVQFMAGKGYYFYYEGGSDTRPSSEDITRTTEEVAQVIKDEDPDIILLQEVDDGAKRTDQENQLERLLSHLPDEYGSYASAFYWKAAFSPHPKILGSVGMKLSVISRYKIDSATRYQIALKPDNWFVRQFDLKRAILELRFPRDEEKDFVVFNTHLTAFAFGTDVRSRQVKEIQSLLKERSSDDHPWIIGGDFNLEPPGPKMDSKEGEVIKPLFDNYRAVPGYDEANGSNPEDWYTHFPNDPDINSPDRTIDYFFLADKLSLGEHYVRQKGTLNISDHLPVVAEVRLPGAS
ncbi:endonuclease/exonuclease/phosphatase family protein [Candidatus Bipolaricaulota bacterium]|nr:endonuclease/exonuclease/phosphatase family protein [Candidatus Bipolaricaulota bacterium]